MSKRQRKVYITGIGITGPCGNNTEDFWKALLSGKSFLTDVPYNGATRLCGCVTGIEPEKMFHAKFLRTCGRFSVLSLLACNEALADAGLDKERRDSRRMGIFIGNNSGGWERAREGLEAVCGGQKPSAYLASNWFPAAAQGHVSLNFEIMGHSKTIAAGTCSSHAAIAHAANLIREGVLDAALAGGAETPVDPWALPFYAAAGCLGTGNYRPFDRAAKGISLGEGAAFLVLESGKSVHDRERATRIRARVGNFRMAFHPQNDAEAYRDVVSLTMDAASPAPDLIFAEGAANPKRDASELEALRGCFGDKIPVTCPRASFGHTVGAAGAFDAALAVLAMERSTVPPVHGLEKPVRSYGGLVHGEPLRKKLRSAMLLARGHDGGAAALALYGVKHKKEVDSFEDA